jgi:hypothetical protein
VISCSLNSQEAKGFNKKQRDLTRLRRDLTRLRRVYKKFYEDLITLLS